VLSGGIGSGRERIFFLDVWTKVIGAGIQTKNRLEDCTALGEGANVGSQYHTCDFRAMR
jgi:hypothetical protein